MAMVKLVYKSATMRVGKNISKDKILDALVDIHPELNSGKYHIVEVLKGGELEWHIVKKDKGYEEKRAANSSYFGYILLGGEFIFFKDMHQMDIVKRVMQVKIGDIFNIKGLGALKVSNVQFQPYNDGYGGKVNEICLVCNRVDA